MTIGALRPIRGGWLLDTPVNCVIALEPAVHDALARMAGVVKRLVLLPHLFHAKDATVAGRWVSTNDFGVGIANVILLSAGSRSPKAETYGEGGDNEDGCDDADDEAGDFAALELPRFY